MSAINRRSFLKQAAAATAAMGAPAIQARGAADRLAVGVIGCSRGVRVGQHFAELGANIAYVCDPDEKRRSDAQKKLKADQAVVDMRRILDDDAVDAVIIATPDHWHAPAAILACEAGKHVYVEKPCSHNIREGRLMIEAARRTNRVTQVGSQSRSTTCLKNAIQRVREGAIGEVLVAKAWNSQRRQNIGHHEPSDSPAGFDYDLWVGPATMRPYQKNCHHYTWHWWYDFGTGDAGNDGVHELDIALWGLGLETLPSHITGHASKMYFDDDQQFPDTQYINYEFPDADGGKPRLITYEHRIWSPYALEGHENANAFYGTEGYMIVAKGGGWWQYGPDNELIEKEEGTCSVPEHVTDFMTAVREGGRPSADIAIGHRAASLAHMANIMGRAGNGALEFDPETERFTNNDAANALLTRTYREGHWSAPKGT